VRASKRKVECVVDNNKNTMAYTVVTAARTRARLVLSKHISKQIINRIERTYGDSWVMSSFSMALEGDKEGVVGAARFLVLEATGVSRATETLEGEGLKIASVKQRLM